MAYGLRGIEATLPAMERLALQLRPPGNIAVPAAVLASNHKFVFYDSDPAVNASAAIVAVTIRANGAGNVRVKATGAAAGTGEVIYLLAGQAYETPIIEVYAADLAATGLIAMHSQPNQIFLRDVTIPAPPTNLALTPGDNTMGLNWDDNSPAPSGYNVYRGLSASGPWKKLNTPLVAVSAYTDSTAVNGTLYYYYVTAVDSSGNESLASAQDSDTPA
jgi:hypothetical protein